MIKPNMPNIPGIGAVTDTLEFVKNLWGGMGLPGMNMAGMSMPGMNIPGMVMPTLSVEEINKKIADLKAVESWLTLNMNMLRGTIQALEVQAATISTLQSMGETFSATMGAAMPEKPAAEAPAAPPNGSNGANGAHAKAGAPEPTSKDEADAAQLTAPLVNAAAWWNMLQDQFKQAVNSAMTAETPSPAAPAARKEKPKARTTSSTTSGGAGAGATRKRKTAK
ncbi:MAG TPA: PhaM family polyhydroxyalkanoate granule multifunctional regulatory protein [Noviherbaspirillum sp.]|nr:PhaM family polyhydroxyalkanoate granule multifunctional regulatory protein [Noviherbaspirillum sp.]